MAGSSFQGGFKGGAIGSSGFGGGPKRGPSKFSIEDVRDFASEHKVESLAIVLTLGLLIGAYVIYADRMAQVTGLSSEIQSLKDKESPVAVFKDLSKKNEELLKGVPQPFADSKLTNFLTGLASKRDISISSIAPVQSKKEGFYVSSVVQLSCSVPSFKDALFFLNDVESSSHALRVISWNIRGPVEGGSMDLDVAGRAPRVGMDISISSVRLLEDGQKNTKTK